MWEAIKTRNLGRICLTRKLSGIASKSATLGEVMSENKLVKKFLTSLPRWLNNPRGLNPPPHRLKPGKALPFQEVGVATSVGFEDVFGRLKAYEERVKEEDKANDAQENLLYARTEYSNRNNDSSRGRGRGSYSRGRGQGRGQEKCTPPKSESNTNEDDVWHFDNGASNHMIENDEEDESGSDGTPTPIAQLETTRLLIALAAGKGWKIHHLDVKMAFINGDRKKLNMYDVRDLARSQDVQGLKEDLESSTLATAS
ncbi:uncharacterized mitochondrial protein-like protein [Tanacetum coccineum]